MVRDQLVACHAVACPKHTATSSQQLLFTLFRWKLCLRLLQHSPPDTQHQEGGVSLWSDTRNQISCSLAKPTYVGNFFIIFLEGCAYCTGFLTAALSADCPGWSVLSPDCIGTGPADLDASPLSAPVSWLAAGSLS